MVRKFSKNPFNYSFLFCFILLTLNLLFFSIVNSSATTQVSLEWVPNSEPNLAGYKIFCREINQSYDYANPSWEVTDSYCTIYDLDENKNYCFVARAFDTEGFESENSNEVCHGPLIIPNQAPNVVLGSNQTVNDGRNVFTSEVQVASGSDDAEERASGYVSLASSDLEMVYDRRYQTVGIRFNSLDIPQGATIVNAYVQFKVDETSSGTTLLTIEGESIDNAMTFTSSNGNISSRARTSTHVSWLPVPWTTVGEAGPDQQTPDISQIIQEIVNHPRWSDGNSLVLIITGTGERVAESYNGDPSGAPMLHVEYAN